MEFPTMVNDNFYKNFIEQLKIKKINFIVCGSHAIWLLNKYYNLDIQVDINRKDLDLFIENKSELEDILKNYEIKTNQQNTKISVYNYEKKIDLIKKLENRCMKIRNNLIVEFCYDNILPYTIDGILYDNEVKCLNLESYYGIVKRTGLRKYKDIIQKILDKYPNLKKEVAA
jgi:hypothetical protein